MLPDSLTLTHAPGLSYSLAVHQPNPVSHPHVWHGSHSANTQAPIYIQTGPLPPGHTLTLYAGKGGYCGLLSAHSSGLTYFLFPGARASVGSECHLEFLGKTLVPTEAGPPVGYHQGWTAPNTQQAVTRQAMVLGAGIGSRILPLTEAFTALAKPALPLDGDHTVIGRIVHQLALHGIEHLYVNTFFERDSVANALHEACQKNGIAWHEIPEQRASGTAGGLNYLLNHLEQYPTFDPALPLLVVQGDAVTTAQFSHLLEAHQQHAPLITLGCQVVGDADVDKFGIIATQSPHPTNPSGPVVGFLEKPSLLEAQGHRLANSGFYVLSPGVYGLLTELYGQKQALFDQTLQAADKPVGAPLPEFDFAKDVFPHLLATATTETQSALWAEKVEGYWCDIGNPAHYLQTLQALYEGWLQTPWPVGNADQGYDPAGVFYWPGTKPLHHLPTNDVSVQGGVIVARTVAAG